MATNNPDQRRIVVLGGGFGGCFTARRLEHHFATDPDVEISLVNRDNYFVFQPLLPEVAAGALAPTHVINPIRRLLTRTRFYASDVTAIDLDRREVVVVVGEGKRLHVLPFDHLVIALGTVVDLSRLPGMAEHSLPMKNLGDAFYLRNHVIGRLEEADMEPDDDLKRALCTFVVVGGGFSGVETMAEVQEMVEAVLPSYPNINHDDVRFVLVHSRDRILPEVVPSLAQYAQDVLARRGIEFVLNTRCAAATSDAVVLNSGLRIQTRTLVCTVGNAPNPLLRTLPLPTERGRLVADNTLKVRGGEGIWSVGDCAWIPGPDGDPYPPTAQNAIRQAECCGDNIAAEIRGETLTPFVFGGLGKLASIGKRSAVAEVMGMKMSGFFAWWMWRTIYWMKLPGWERKVRVALDWTLDLFFRRDLVQLKVFPTEVVDQAHFETGEDIVKQGEVGDKFYVIVSGQVEVLQQGNGEVKRLRTMGPGEHFGEIALIKDTRRTATVRAMEPTNVVAVSSGAFSAVAENFSALRTIIDDAVKIRK